MLSRKNQSLSLFFLFPFLSFFISLCLSLLFFMLLCTEQNSHTGNRMLELPLVFTGCSSIQFLIHRLFQTQSVRSPLLPSHSLLNTCVTYGTSCCSIAHQLLPTQPLPREARDFTRGGKYVKQVPLSTYLVSHQNCKTWQVLFYVLGSVTEHYINPRWFSIHFLTT